MKKITDTNGLFDLSGEDVEGWEVGDKFKLADHAEPIEWFDRDHVFTVAFIEINWDEDFNDFVLYAVETGQNTNHAHEVIGVHRMDAVRVDDNSFTYGDRVFIYGDRVIWTDPDGGNEITGTVRSDLDHDGQFWVHFDGTDPNVQTEVYAHELRYV